MHHLAEKVAIVTGAGDGIGGAYAKHLAGLGATTWVADINEEAAGQTAESIVSNGGSAELCTVDISDPESCSGLVERVMAKSGRLDVLVNNAAIFRGMSSGPSEDLDVREWRRMMDVNVSGTWFMCRSAIGPMKSQRSGRIINQSSIVSWLHSPGVIHYAVSKRAIIEITQVLAGELGEYGITCNAIAPGIIRTPASDELNGGKPSPLLPLSRIPREGTPADLLGTLEFLCTGASDYITGQVLVVDGGICMIS